MQELLQHPAMIEIILGLAYLAGGLAMLLVAKLLYQLVSPFKLDYELTQNDNPALGLAMCGYYLGVAVVFVGSVYEPSGSHGYNNVKDLVLSLCGDLSYAFVGIVFMLFGALLVDKLLLPKFSATREIVTDRNMGMGWLQFGSYVASALAVAGAINSNWGGILASLVMALLGQLAIIATGFGYRHLAGYDVAKEIEEDNVAAGGSLGMALIAVGVVVCRIAAADYSDYLDALIWFVADTLVSIIILLVLRWFTDLVFLPDATYKEEVVRDRNINAAFIEGGLAIAIAIIISFAL